MDLTGGADLPLPERRSYLGALLTVGALGLWFTYIVTLTLAWAKNPPRSTSDIRWSQSQGPSQGSGPPSFPIELVCSAAEGCSMALHYSGQTPLSARCAASVANQSCVTAAQGERLSTALCYSDQPYDGLYAAIDNASLGVLSVSEAPLMEMTFPLHRGRTQLHLVITTNDTYAEGSLGHSRSEWFPTLLSAAVGMPADAARVCGDSAGKDVALLSISSEWTEVQVPAAIWSFLELFGEWGGTWTLLLDLTALVVLVNYHTALFAQKGHRGLREATTWREQPRQKPRKMSPQPEDQGDVGMQV